MVSHIDSTNLSEGASTKPSPTSTIFDQGCSNWMRTRKGSPIKQTHSLVIGRNEMSFVARRLAAFSTAMILLAASQGRRICPETIRYRRNRYRDQDRQHHAIQRARIGLRRYRQDRGGLFPQDQRRGWDQWPQDHFIS